MLKHIKNNRIHYLLYSLLIVLFSMTLWDFSLHFVQLFNLVDMHPLYPYFIDRHQYEVFWNVYWLCATVLIGVILIVIMKYSRSFDAKKTVV